MYEKNQKYSKFKQACIQSYMEQCEKIESIQMPIEYSNTHKKRINRIPREILGTTTPIYPETDNIFERMRSKVIRFINTHKK